MNAGAPSIGQRHAARVALLWLLSIPYIAAAETQILGHRGFAWNQAGHPWPENTVLSVKAALAAGADGAEIDVLRSADGVIVLRHDDHLSHPARGGPPKTDCVGQISQLSWSHLRDCRALSGAPGGFSTPLDRLEDLLILEMRLLVLDVKDDHLGLEPEAAVRAIAAQVKAAGAQDRVVLMLYHAVTVERAVALGLKVCVKQRQPQGDAEMVAEVVERGAWGSCPSSRLLKPSTTARLRERGLAQIPYLLTRPESQGFERGFDALLDLRVNAVITDRITSARQRRADIRLKSLLSNP